MQTQCNQESFEFHPLGQRQVQGRFDGGAITSDAGGLLLRALEKRAGILVRFAGCFRDHQKPSQVEHAVRGLVAKRFCTGNWSWHRPPILRPRGDCLGPRSARQPSLFSSSHSNTSTPQGGYDVPRLFHSIRILDFIFLARLE